MIAATRTEDLLQVSREMLAAAQRSDWEQLELLHARREVMLEQWPSATAATARLEELLRLNDMLIGATAAARDAVGTELQLVAHGRRAQRAYGNTTTP